MRTLFPELKSWRISAFLAFFLTYPACGDESGFPGEPGPVPLVEPTRSAALRQEEKTATGVVQLASESQELPPVLSLTSGFAEPTPDNNAAGSQVGSTIQPKQDDSLVDAPAADLPPAQSGFLFRQSTSDEEKKRPRWIEHNVMPGERLDDIASRYGVSEKHVQRVNKLDRKRPRLIAGAKLRIRAKEFPPPQVFSKYRVKEGETWRSVASKFGMSVSTLKRFNRHKKVIRKGTFLKIWKRSGIRPEEQGYQLSLRAPEIPPGGYSRGRPNRGRLISGVQLPESDLYTVRVPHHAYGSSHALGVIAASIADFRTRTRFAGEVIVSGISRRRGGRFPPHRSHQSGRDVDIALVAYPSMPEGTRARGGDVDWAATWELIRSFIASGEVQYVFLSYRQQKKLYHAARLLGASEEELSETIQWPRGPKSIYGIVRHERGHLAHFHVRIYCGKEEERCRPQRDKSKHSIGALASAKTSGSPG